MTASGPKAAIVRQKSPPSCEKGLPDQGCKERMESAFGSLESSTNANSRRSRTDLSRIETQKKSDTSVAEK
jgi:hypothetical protein